MTINQDTDPQQRSEEIRESLRLIFKSIPVKIKAQVTLDQYLNFGFRPDHASLEDNIIGESCTIYLQAIELFRLTKQDFKSVTQEFKDQCLQSPQSTVFDSESLSHIEPESNSNIIEHEKQHLRKLPENIITDSKVRISFVWDNGGMFILGLAMPPTPLDKKTEATMSTEPDWLSGADIESARQTCVELDDFEFTSFIEQRIIGKPNNLVNFE